MLLFIVLIFIITVIMIAMYYNNCYNKNIESFDDVSNNISNDILKSISRMGITDERIIKILNAGVDNLKTTINTNINLDVPVGLNDNGEICMQWGSYDNEKYKLNGNKCLVLENSRDGEHQCLGNNNSLVNCNYLFRDGYINNKSVINPNTILSSIKSDLENRLNNINNDISIKTKTVDGYVTELIAKKQLENQQRYFIDYNTDNINDKENQLKINENELDEKQNNVGLNYINFKNYTEKNKTNEYWINIYYNIIIVLVILIILFVVLAILFSNIL